MPAWRFLPSHFQLEFFPLWMINSVALMNFYGTFKPIHGFLTNLNNRKLVPHLNRVTKSNFRILGIHRMEFGHFWVEILGWEIHCVPKVGKFFKKKVENTHFSRNFQLLNMYKIDISWFNTLNHLFEFSEQWLQKCDKLKRMQQKIVYHREQ